MNRCSFLFITLLAPCVFTLSSGHIQTKAENIPVLSYTAKKAPQAETKTNQTPSRLTNSKKIVPQNTSSCTPLILGSHGDISSVKARASRASLTAKNKPRLKELKNISYPTARSAAFNKRITSKSAIIMDAETGRTIFAKAPDNPRQPASTIKVLTGMIAIKRLKNNEKVGVSRHAEKMPRSKVYLSTKKKYKANDLINSVLLASANDASVALAEKIAGSEADFAKLMTLHARLWGAKNTVCRTASGLTAKGQQSTARDLAQIFRHAMQDKEFANRMKRTKIKTSYGKLLRNHNRALWQVDGALAGKTGYTNKARQTYVGQFQRGDDTIVVAIMGSETMWTDIKRLVEYGFKKKEQIRVAQLAETKTES